MTSMPTRILVRQIEAIKALHPGMPVADAVRLRLDMGIGVGQKLEPEGLFVMHPAQIGVLRDESKRLRICTGNSMGKTYQIVGPGFTGEQAQRAVERLKARLSDAFGQEVNPDGAPSSVQRDTCTIVEPLAALAGGPGAVVEDAPTAAATGGQAAVVVQTDDEHEQVPVKGLGDVGTGAEHVVSPGAERADLDNGRRGVR